MTIEVEGGGGTAETSLVRGFRGLERTEGALRGSDVRKGGEKGEHLVRLTRERKLNSRGFGGSPVIAKENHEDVRAMSGGRMW